MASRANATHGSSASPRATGRKVCALRALTSPRRTASRRRERVRSSRARRAASCAPGRSLPLRPRRGSGSRTPDAPNGVTSSRYSSSSTGRPRPGVHSRACRRRTRSARPPAPPLPDSGPTGTSAVSRDRQSPRPSTGRAPSACPLFRAGTPGSTRTGGRGSSWSVPQDLSQAATSSCATYSPVASGRARTSWAVPS